MVGPSGLPKATSTRVPRYPGRIDGRRGSAVVERRGDRRTYSGGRYGGGYRGVEIDEDNGKGKAHRGL